MSIERVDPATLIESTAVPGVFWSPDTPFVYNGEGYPLVMKPLGIDENRDGILNFRIEPAVEADMNRGHLQVERLKLLSMPLDQKWRDETVARIAGPKDCLPYAQRLDAARSAMRETMVAMDAKAQRFLDALLKQAESQRPHVINADAIRKLAKDHGLA